MCPYITKGWASFDGQILTSWLFCFILFSIFFFSSTLTFFVYSWCCCLRLPERKRYRIRHDVCMQSAWPFPYSAYGKTTTYLLSIDSLFLLVPFVARPLVSSLFHAMCHKCFVYWFCCTLCKSFRSLFNFFEKRKDLSNRSTNWYRLDLVRNLNRLCDLFIEIIVRIDFAGCVR